MLIGQVNPTPYDLAFRVFGIPVRVHPLFWVVSALLGWELFRWGGATYLFLWIACMFVSILIHELGHALTALYFGWPPEISLYHFGGLAVYTPRYREHTTARSILISFAGPGAGFAFYGVVWLAGYLLDRTGTDVNFFVLNALDWLEQINLWWGLINLLPVLPLDGGRIAEAILVDRRPHDGQSITYKIGVVAGVAAAIGLWMSDLGRFSGIFFALLAFDNYQRLQERRGIVW